MTFIKGLINNLFSINQENWKVVVLCVLGATTFWFFNALNKTYTTTIHYPIEITFDEEKFIEVNPPSSHVQLEVTGGGWNLLRKTFWFKVDPIIFPLEDPARTKSFTGQVLQNTISDQVTELRINNLLTESVDFDIQEIVTKRLKVVINQEAISLRKNHRIVSDIEVFPDSIFVTGPKSMMDTLAGFYGVTLSASSIDEDYQKDLRVVPPHKNLSKVSPEKVKVSFEVAEFVSASAMVPVQFKNIPRKFPIQRLDSLIQVEFLIRKDSLEKISEWPISAEADFNQLLKPDSTLRVKITEYPTHYEEFSIPNPFIYVGRKE